MGLFIDKNIVVYFNCFGIKYIPQDVLNKIKDKSNTLNISRKQSDDSIRCEFYSIAFKEHMLAGKTLPYYTNFFFLLTTIRRWTIKDNTGLDFRFKKRWNKKLTTATIKIYITYCRNQKA